MHYNRPMTIRRRRRATTREEVVNTLLAQELRRHGLSARAERRTHEGVPDVRIELRGGELVLLECKWESTAAQLDEQLEERLEQFPDAVAVVGVIYPDSLRETDDTQAALTAETGLRWRIHGSRGGGTPGSPERSGSVEDLAHQLRLLPLELEGTDKVAAAAGIIRYAVEQAVAPIRRAPRSGNGAGGLQPAAVRGKGESLSRRFSTARLTNYALLLSYRPRQLPSLRHWQTG